MISGRLSNRPSCLATSLRRTRKARQLPLRTKRLAHLETIAVAVPLQVSLRRVHLIDMAITRAGNMDDVRRAPTMPTAYHVIPFDLPCQIRDPLVEVDEADARTCPQVIYFGFLGGTQRPMQGLHGAEGHFRDGKHRGDDLDRAANV